MMIAHHRLPMSNAGSKGCRMRSAYFLIALLLPALLASGKGWRNMCHASMGDGKEGAPRSVAAAQRLNQCWLAASGRAHPAHHPSAAHPHMGHCAHGTAAQHSTAALQHCSHSSFSTAAASHPEVVGCHDMDTMLNHCHGPRHPLPPCHLHPTGQDVPATSQDVTDLSNLEFAQADVGELAASV